MKDIIVQQGLSADECRQTLLDQYQPPAARPVKFSQNEVQLGILPLNLVTITAGIVNGVPEKLEAIYRQIDHIPTGGLDVGDMFNIGMSYAGICLGVTMTSYWIGREIISHAVHKALYKDSVDQFIKSEYGEKRF